MTNDVESQWPEEVLDFEIFLESHGFTRMQMSVDNINFGNRLLQFGSSVLLVQVVSDRGFWFARVAELINPRKWYNPEMLAQLIDGRDPVAMSLPEQLVFLRENLEKLDELFELDRADATRLQLLDLGRKRVERLFG